MSAAVPEYRAEGRGDVVSLAAEMAESFVSRARRLRPEWSERRIARERVKAAERRLAGEPSDVAYAAAARIELAEAKAALT